MFPRQPAGAQKLTTQPARRTGHSSQMLNNDPQKDSRDRQDEARLLGGSYKCVVRLRGCIEILMLTGVSLVGRDPQAVKIKTGATMQSKNKKPGVSISCQIMRIKLCLTLPQSNYSFSPSDKISDKSRTSGPIRARGKSKQQTSNMGRNPTLLDDVFEESSRPNKRRRQSDVGHEIDRTATANPNMDRSQQTILSSPLQNLRPKHKGAAGLSQYLDEYKEVERNVRISPSARRTQISQFSFSDSHDEKFTEKAAQQRRDMTNAADARLSQVNGKPKGAGEGRFMDRIEIGTKKSNKDRSAVSSNASRPPVNGRESPDELQGDITTHPMPKSLTEKPIKAARQSRIEIHPQSVTRKRSPSDIQPTDFSSPPQDKKKAKRSHQKPAKKSILQASYYRIGSFSKTCTRDEFAPIHIVDIGLQLREDLLGPDNVLLIHFEKITNILVGEGTSRKVRLSMMGARNDSNERFDVEFWTQDEKSAMLKIVQSPNIAQEFRDAYEFQMTSCIVTVR